jgi:hypothetical protein
MTERTTVRLPDELVRRAKRLAAEEGRSLTALIEEALRRILNERKNGRRSQRILPPVSKATGGLRPGISLDSMADLQEMDDLEYISRFR